MSKITLIGIDTAKQVFHMVGIDQHGKYVWRKKVARRKFVSTLAQLEPCKVVLEACGASHHWARQIKACGHDVRLIAPQHVKTFRRGQKNDYRDAEAIIAAARRLGLQPDNPELAGGIPATRVLRRPVGNHQRPKRILNVGAPNVPSGSDRKTPRRHTNILVALLRNTCGGTVLGNRFQII